MTDTNAAKKVELAQKHINYQRQRIAHQKEFICCAVAPIPTVMHGS